MAPKFLKKLFAEEGETEEIPDALQPTGIVSFATGYGFDYERDPASDPNAKDIERKKMNWLFRTITEGLQRFQAVGTYPYITADDNGGTAYAYAKGARCQYNKALYESLVDNNAALPTDTAKWRDISAGAQNWAPSGHGHVMGDVSGLDSALLDINATLAAKAPLVSPALTGSPTAPTAAAATNNTQVATTAYVTTALTAKANAAHIHPSADVTGLTASLAAKAPLVSPALTGTPTAPTADAATNSTQVATTAYVTTALTAKAPLVSPALTGTPTAPTAAAATNNTQIATTAYVTTGLATKAAASHTHAVSDLSGVMPIASGGTGATTAALARNALGLGNTTAALPVANGGTGAATAALALTNLGAAPLPKAAAGVGQWLHLSTRGAAPTLPAGGTWAWFGIRSTIASGTSAAQTDTGAGVSAGGTVIQLDATLGQSPANYSYGALALRIA